ncbi:hypothetical protein T09_12178, partial [Trichinella sp. T9]
LNVHEFFGMKERNNSNFRNERQWEMKIQLNESESARDEMVVEYDELLRQENSDDAEKMRRLLDEVDVLWSHVAVADAVVDYVVTLEKISIKALDNSNKLKLSRKLYGFIVRDRGIQTTSAVFGPEKAEILKLEKEKQLIADLLAVLDQEHDHTLGERIQDSSC